MAILKLDYFVQLSNGWNKVVDKNCPVFGLLGPAEIDDSKTEIEFSDVYCTWVFTEMQDTPPYQL
jgi:hypothetical protein